VSLLPYKLELQWTGNKGRGTEQYTSYDRSYTIRCAGKEDLHLSSDPHFRGDAGLYNPEELLLMAAASCHMLWYLHLCADAGLIVESYHDLPTATLRIDEKGSGKFEKIELNPSVILRAGSDPELAQALHGKANQMCFIANSLNIKISHRPTLRISS
jgi:organic hydroperoxide reductase OsmC/OhrA